MHELAPGDSAQLMDADPGEAGRALRELNHQTRTWTEVLGRSWTSGPPDASTTSCTAAFPVSSSVPGANATSTVVSRSWTAWALHAYRLIR